MTTVSRERIPTVGQERLTLEVSDCQGIPTVHCEGELDICTSTWFQEIVEQRLASHHSLIVDLTKVDLVDAHSWGLLIKFLKRAKKLGGNICLVIAEGQNLVRRTFEITNLHTVFDHDPSLVVARQFLS